MAKWGQSGVILSGSGSRASNIADVAVIIPTLNEAETITGALESARMQNPRPREIVVVDGGSNDGTSHIAREKGVRILFSAPGRGGQLHTGALAATARTLLFLHADSRLPQGAIRSIQSALGQDGVRGGKFRLWFEHRHPVLAVLAFFSRFSWDWVSFGDAGFFVSRAQYLKLGGFKEIPLFEDVDFFRRLKKEARVRVLPLKVTASCRRFCRGGVVRQLLFNAVLFCAYKIGVSPHRLAEWYKPWRDHAAPTKETLRPVSGVVPENQVRR